MSVILYLTSRQVWRTEKAAGLHLTESEAEIVLQAEDQRQETDLLVESADDAANLIEEAGGKSILPRFDIQIGRCVVVEDPWGNPLVMLETDSDGNVIDRSKS